MAMAKKKSSKPETSPAPQPESLPEGYDQFFGSLKERIRKAQLRAVLSVNHELVLLYWELGRDILARQEEQGWGAKVIDRLAADLRRAFPEMSGFSPRNLKYMRSFASAWPDGPIVQGPLAQITWYHNVALVEKLKDSNERLWYARAAGGSRLGRESGWLA
jgi:predicted nuclease of restriction endonuclease-like (RecB) superfamily